ncbi:ComEC/Rec2 family competence protein [Mycobacterium sp. ITM-2016-00318]|uniref:ComEC/Rec2 family competence protein n=1 Tax=Mycobacterium sp. ITM-2016-00318 TaxID=2099693 RepID=UPI001E5C689C|nr:ComEC/Rec2 family competence protein [Mycobacterium sp. ITM-2016-00318]WNG91217.1 ComEC/Rec2 family competence protein [Mycobacterium sp. ITM-2016-00318]
MSIPVDGREGRVDLRLVPAALTSWTVTAGGILWSVTGVVVVAISVVVAAGVAAWWGSRPHRSDSDAGMTAAGATAILLTGLTFGIAVLLRVDHVSSHPLTERYGDVGTVIVTPSESPRSVGGSRVMFRGALRAVDAVEMSGSVVVFASVAGFAGITVGQPAAFTARISRPNRRDLTVAALSATGRPTLGKAAPIQRAGQRVRDEFSRTARDALPADQAAMLPALVLGDTSTLPADTVKQFRLSGLTHLTAVSGANVTIVCGAVLLTAAVVGPHVAVALAGTALVAFVIVVQPSASVLRAAVMAAITLLALVTHRRRQAIPVLSAAVIALMIAAPELAVDIGFALSVSATAALVVVAPGWSRRLVARGWPKPLADALSVAVAAQLVTAPLVAAISGTFSVVAVVANLAAAIVVVPITVIGTAAAGLAVVWPAGADLLIRFTGPELWWLLTVARWSAGVPGASLSVPDGISGALIVFAVGVGAFIAVRWCRRRVSARHDTI